MTFQLDKANRIFGEMSIENIFIEECLPDANGTYVKVYLLGLYYAKHSDEELSSNQDIADKLGIPLSDVHNAWKYWESVGVVKLEQVFAAMDTPPELVVTFLSLRNLLTGAKSEPQVATISNADVIDSMQIPIIAMMYQRINVIVMRETTPNEKRSILEWISNYNVDADVVVEAFRYSYEIRGKRSLKYVEAVVRNWSQEGAVDLVTLQALLEKKDVDFVRYQRIMNALGLQNKPYNQGDALKIKSWYYEMKFDDIMILKACEASSKVKTVSVNYINSILRSWYEKGIKNVDEIEKLDVKSTQQKSKNTVSNKSTGFTNFRGNSPLTEDQLKELERAQREAILKRGDDGGR